MVFDEATCCLCCENVMTYNKLITKSACVDVDLQAIIYIFGVSTSWDYFGKENSVAIIV